MNRHWIKHYPGHVNRQPEIPGQTVVERFHESCVIHNAQPALAGDDIALLQYTGGTDGGR